MLKYWLAMVKKFLRCLLKNRAIKIESEKSLFRQKGGKVAPLMTKVLSFSSFMQKDGLEEKRDKGACLSDDGNSFYR